MQEKNISTFAQPMNWPEVNQGRFQQWENADKLEEDIALSHIDGKFYARSNVCLHPRGPLKKEKLNGNIVTSC